MRLPVALHVPVAIAAAGMAGGAVAGAFDGLATEIWVGGLDTRAGVLCVALGFAVGALVGGLLALVFALLQAAAHRVLRVLGKPAPGRAAALAAVMLAAPMVWVVAFAMFGGPWAKKIPGRHAISVGLIVVGLGVVWGLARGFARIFARGWTVPTAPSDRGWVVALVVLCGVAPWPITVANARILPRLYPWFHVVLLLAAFVMAALAVGGLIASTGRGDRVRRGAAVAFGALCMTAGVVLVAGPWSFSALVTRSDYRFAMLGKSPALQYLLQRLPLPRPRWARDPGRVDPAALDPAAPLGAGPRRPDADVVVITIDAARPDHIGAYGYARPTTPNLDRLAKQGVLFRRAYAQAPHTSFSITSMLTGKYYPTLTRLGGGQADEAMTVLLRRYGWRTAAFYPPAVFFVDGDQLAAFRDSHFQFEYVKHEFLDAHERIDQIEEYFRVVNPDRAFLWVHFFEPHEPYLSHPGFEFGDSDIDRYDSELAYTDAAIGKLIDFIDRERPGAIVIVAADHGEEFDDHGGRYHGTTLYEEQIRVPFIVRVPGVAPREVEGPVELVDIAPTVFGLLDFPRVPRLRGDDLGPWLTDAPAPDDAFPPAFAELDRLRMVATARDKMICRLDDESCELFDLVDDPGETRNLIDQRPDTMAVLRGHLERWLVRQAALEPFAIAGEGQGDGARIPMAIERGRLGDVTAADELLELVRARDVPVTIRGLAAQTLALLPPPPYLRGRLEQSLAKGSDDEAVGRWLVVAAAAAGVPTALEAVAGFVASAPPRQASTPDAGVGVQGADSLGGPASPDFFLHAALALAASGDARAASELTAALATATCGAAGTCRQVVNALGTLRDRQVVPVLIERLDDVMIRRELIAALGQIGDPKAFPALRRHLWNDEYVPVRAEAARALGRLGGRSATAALRTARQRETERQVREAIDDAINQVRAAPRESGTDAAGAVPSGDR